MRIKKKKAGGTEIDVGSFSDIAFLLIIFFILTTTFEKPAGEKADFPRGEPPSPNDPKSDKQDTINLKGSTIRWTSAKGGGEGEVIGLDELRTELFKLKLEERANDQRSIILDSGPEVPYEIYYQVMMAITRAGGVVAIMEMEGEDSSGGGP